MRLSSLFTVSAYALYTTAASWSQTDTHQFRLDNTAANVERNATFDYVVVGGGTAGLAIANRLAEDGLWTVAVVEAGGFYQAENGNVSVVPAYNQEYDYIDPESRLNMSRVNWGFLTTPQAGAQNQIFHYGRGKVLGGCSAQNAMNYNRPTVGALQLWADTVNDSSYTWDQFLPFFQRSINYSNPDMEFRAPNATVPYVLPVNQTDGPLQVSFSRWAAPFSTWAQLALRELGIPDVRDLVNGKLIGSQYSPLTIDPEDQSRSSSQTSFLDEALARRKASLHIYLHTLAKRVLFTDDKTAYGVLVQGDASPRPYTLIARKEVIISAGVFQSPQLLMVSGVGPSRTLGSHGIPVLADRPGVGQNMWDHVVFSLGHQVDVETYGRLSDPTLDLKAKNEYNQNRTGILTSGLSDYLGWENLPMQYRSNFSTEAANDLARFPADWPEVEYEISSAPFGTGSFSTPDRPIDVAYVQPVLLTPLSRGNVSISSSSMIDPPLINPNWLTHPTDQQVAIATMRRARNIFTTSAMQPILLGTELLPGLNNLPYNATDAQILQYLQMNAAFNWHAACTCRMGRSDDPMAVIDSRARVIGVQGLRVVDASSFPLLPPGHPQATIYALAEKIAQDILMPEHDD